MLLQGDDIVPNASDMLLATVIKIGHHGGAEIDA